MNHNTFLTLSATRRQVHVCLLNPVWVRLQLSWHCAGAGSGHGGLRHHQEDQAGAVRAARHLPDGRHAGQCPSAGGVTWWRGVSGHALDPGHRGHAHRQLHHPRLPPGGGAAEEGARTVPSGHRGNVTILQCLVWRRSSSTILSCRKLTALRSTLDRGRRRCCRRTTSTLRAWRTSRTAWPTGGRTSSPAPRSATSSSPPASTSTRRPSRCAASSTASRGSTRGRTIGCPGNHVWIDYVNANIKHS